MNLLHLAVNRIFNTNFRHAFALVRSTAVTRQHAFKISQSQDYWTVLTLRSAVFSAKMCLL